VLARDMNQCKRTTECVREHDNYKRAYALAGVGYSRCCLCGLLRVRVCRTAAFLSVVTEPTMEVLGQCALRIGLRIKIVTLSACLAASRKVTESNRSSRARRNALAHTHKDLHRAASPLLSHAHEAHNRIATHLAQGCVDAS
jgi:hypothetical protein